MALPPSRLPPPPTKATSLHRFTGLCASPDAQALVALIIMFGAGCAVGWIGALIAVAVL